jgi:hypothetical protein
VREAAAARRRLTGATATLVALSLVAACTGGDGASTAATAAPTVAVDELPAAVPSEPATTAASALEVPSAPTFAPGALVAATTATPWVLVGTGRHDAGAPARLTAFSSADGSTWEPLDLAAGDHTGATAAYGAPDGTVVIGGHVDGDDGAHPAVWQLRDGALAAPDVLGGVAGRVTAMAADPTGAPVLLVATAEGPTVAVRGPAGWLTTPLPGGGAAGDIGVSATTTVVTGSSVWRSTDGSRTFEVTPAPPFLGAVLATPGGFVAASCATGGLVLSPDGRVWTDLPILHPRAVVPVAAGGCGTIAPDADGGVWLASTVGDPVVFRATGQLVDRLGVPARPPGTVFAGAPLVAAAGGTVVVAVPQPGGVATAAAPSVALTTDLELDVAMPATTGATPGHPAPTGVVPLDDRGGRVGITTYPVVVDAADGSYRWTTSLTAARLDAAGELVAAARAAPAGPEGALGGIVGLGAGDVALATVLDEDMAAGYGGPVGDVVMSSRDSDGAWRRREIVAGGAGRQAVQAVVAAGGVAVGVGEEVTLDAAGAMVVAPLVLASDGTSTRRIPAAVGAVSFAAACPGPGGTVFAVGTDTATGAGVVATIDVRAETVTTATGPAGLTSPGCAGNGETILMAVEGSVIASTDGITFTPVATVGPGERVTALAAGPSGFAVAGTTVTGDGFVLHGGRADALRRLAAAALGGPGDQEPTGLVVRAGDVVVLGLDDGAPTTWRLPIG